MFPYERTLLVYFNSVRYSSQRLMNHVLRILNLKLNGVPSLIRVLRDDKSKKNPRHFHHRISFLQPRHVHSLAGKHGKRETEWKWIMGLQNSVNPGASGDQKPSGPLTKALPWTRRGPCSPQLPSIFFQVFKFGQLSTLQVFFRIQNWRKLKKTQHQLE